jgi:predicted  nucleic acid-binding Zn-ribbon protein
MSKAQVGHSAFDAESGIVGQLSEMDNDNRIKFLRAAVIHAEQQRDILEDQHEQLVDKYEIIQGQWTAKIDEAADMRDEAENTLEALSRELDALDG